MTEELVLLTLEELQEKGLFEGGTMELSPQGTSRRQMISKIGLAAAALLPVVAAITAPPALAQSGSVGTDSLSARKRAAKKQVSPLPPP